MSSNIIVTRICQHCGKEFQAKTTVTKFCNHKCSRAAYKSGQLIKVAGLVLVRQRPGTAGVVCFITIEDETGFTNLVVFQSLFDKYRKEILQAKLLMVEGRLQREGSVVHVIVSRCFDLSKLLHHLVLRQQDDLPLLTLARGDEKSAPYAAVNKKAQVRQVAANDVFSKGRNFK